MSWSSARERAQGVGFGYFAEPVEIEVGGEVIRCDAILDTSYGEGDAAAEGAFSQLASLSVKAADFGPTPEVGERIKANGRLYFVTESEKTAGLLDIKLQAHTY